MFSLLPKQKIARIALVSMLSGMTLAADAGKPKQTAAPTQTPAAATASVAKPDAASPTGVDTAKPAAITHSSVPPLTVPQEIAKLPKLENTGVDVAAQSKAILANLNAILSFYRAAIAPIQKAGEPSDVLYAGQAQTQAIQIAQLAFQSAKNEGALLAKVSGSVTTGTPVTDPNAAPTEAQKLAGFRNRITAQIADLDKQAADIATQLQHANAKTRPTLLQRQEQLEGELELQKATADALARISTFSDSQSKTGLAGDIDRLQRSVPELGAESSATSKPVASAMLESLNDMREAGVTTQAAALFDLLSTRRSIDGLIQNDDRLRQQAADLRTPFTKILRSTLARGQELSQQQIDLAATPTTDAQDLASTKQQFDQLTATFHALADAMLPLSQEIVLLEAERGTLSTWRNAVDAEYRIVLRSLLMRLAFIAGALLLLLLISTVWSRATVRYVSDLRRRRQLLLLRRIVIGFVGGLIVIFGFITQFSSLATFAGFITAGIAVGLQTILLSVAAYFFIIGRYGVRVGDRITVAGVTGDVVEVGLVRFYLTELAGSGTELHPTGRVAVFANSVLFQTGTPLYKQMPGTEYAWHELIAKLKPTADIEAIRAALLHAVNEAYSTYKDKIDQQHRQVETWMGTAMEAPVVSSRLQMIDGTPLIAVLFPVQIADAAETDQKIVTTIIQAMNTESAMQAGLLAVPSLNATIKA
jgi:small-conductance mechanosensitive channel